MPALVFLLQQVGRPAESLASTKQEVVVTQYQVKLQDMTSELTGSMTQWHVFTGLSLILGMSRR